MLFSKDEVNTGDMVDPNNNIALLDKVSLTISAWKNEILDNLEDTVPYADVGGEFWNKFRDRFLVSDNQGATKIPESFFFDQQDALLESMEGYEIGVNIAFLAQFSQFIHSTFYGSGAIKYMEAKTRRVRLQLFRYRPLLATLLLLDKILSSISEPSWLSLVSAFPILDVASFLQIKVVLDAVSTVICQKISFASLLDAYRFAEIRYAPLASSLWNMIINDFDLLVKNQKYLDLEAHQLISLLKEPKLNITPEEECPLIWEWIQQNNLSGSSNDIDELKLALCKAEDQTSGVLGAGFLDRPRIPKSILVAIGGWGAFGPMNFLDVYEPNRRCWMSVKSDSHLGSSAKIRAYHETVVNGSDLYILGGYDGNHYLNSIEKLNLDTMEWSTVTPMQEQRCYLACTLVGSNHIIAVGGFDNVARLKSAEVLNIRQNRWVRAASMSFVRSDCACLNLLERSYAIGGFDGQVCHKSAEFYDPNYNKWFPLSRSMRHKRSGLKGVQIGGVLMVAGGFTGEDRLKEVEFYDPREGLWHPLANMEVRRSNFGIETLGSNVIVCGGYSELSTTNVAESFDWRNNSWSEIPEMLSNRSALTLARIDRHPVIEQMVNEYDFGMPFEFL